MRQDRRSMYHAAFDAPSQVQALANEFAGGMDILAAESVAGARRFAKGQGRSGAFEKPSTTAPNSSSSDSGSSKPSRQGQGGGSGGDGVDSQAMPMPKSKL